jgi:hypothetical protein
MPDSTRQGDVETTLNASERLKLRCLELAVQAQSNAHHPAGLARDFFEFIKKKEDLAEISHKILLELRIA